MVYQLIVDRFTLPDVADAYSDEPFKLREAAWLPELCGVFSEKQLRSAIQAGKLTAEKHGRTYYVTRLNVAAWREKCRENVSPPVSGSNPLNSKPMARSSEQPSGTSSTVAHDAALDAARATLLALKKH